MVTDAYSWKLTSCRTYFSYSRVCLTTSFSELSFPPMRFPGSFVSFVFDGFTPYVSPLSSFSFEVYSFRDKTKGSYSNKGINFFHLRNHVFVQPFIFLVLSTNLPNTFKTMSWNATHLKFASFSSIDMLWTSHEVKYYAFRIHYFLQRQYRNWKVFSSKSPPKVCLTFH